MSTGNGTTRDYSPPYLPFNTLMSLIGRMADEGMPTRIDKSYLHSQSGAVQSQTLTGLRFLGLMDDDGLLTEDFKRLVKADEDESRQLIGELLRRKYPDVVQLGTTNATQLQLEEAFDAMGVKGETRRKAIAFYLKAAAHAGIATSKQWTVPRVTAGRARRKKPPAGASQGGTTTPPAATSVEGHSQTVNLGSGGTVAVAVSVNLWDLDGDDLTFVLDLVERVKQYQRGQSDHRTDRNSDDAAA